MGADYTALAVIGIALPDGDDLPKAKTFVRKKAFVHNYDDDGTNEFHPKTGKKLFLDEKIEVEADYPLYVYDLYDDEEPSDLENDNNQTIIRPPKGLKFAVGTDESNICLGAVIRTGSSNGGDEYGFLKIPDLYIANVKARLKDLLEPHGLWDEGKFGLHAILQCSY